MQTLLLLEHARQPNEPVGLDRFEHLHRVAVEGDGLLRQVLAGQLHEGELALERTAEGVAVVVAMDHFHHSQNYFPPAPEC